MRNQLSFIEVTTNELSTLLKNKASFLLIHF